MTRPMVIAHRTCPDDAPENSLAGIRIAAALGADAVEIDLRMSLDQKPFLLHDWTLRRTAGRPLPLEVTPSWVARDLLLRGSEERLPALAAAFDALPDGLRVAVDVKTPWAMPALVNEIRRRGWQERALIWCTSALAVRYAVQRAPGVEVAYLKTALSEPAQWRFINGAKRLGAAAISAHWLAIDAAFVETAHAAGLRVYSYDERRPLTPEKLSSGIDGVITDAVTQARSLADAMHEVD